MHFLERFGGDFYQSLGAIQIRYKKNPTVKARNIVNVSFDHFTMSILLV